jgi:signal transduction histidine kinase
MSANETQKSGQATMRPRARLIALLGDELISDELVAVVELVKNAYDADASRVSISFEVDEAGTPVRLIVKDDGVGMNLETILRGWFEPGTTLKKSTDRSAKGRPYQGAKGVGRFAAARLGESLFLETRARGASEGVTVLLEWGRFDDDSYLDQVAITYETNDATLIPEGTTLTIEQLAAKKVWQEEDFKSLHDRLSRLISPFSEVNDFVVDLLVPGYPDLTGTVEPHALTKQPKYRLIGSLSESGLLQATMEIDGKPHKNYVDRPISDGETLACGPLEFEIRAWDRDRPGLSPYMLAFDQTLTAIRHILDTYSGVSIYRDGFRVHPYGEPGFDWLQLDNQSRQNPTLRLAKNQVIASIRTTRVRNPELRDRTTREGLVHNVAYDELKKYFLLTLQVLEEERYRVRPREDAKPEYTTSLFEAFDLTEVVSQVDEQLGKKHPVAKLVRTKDQEIRMGVQKLQEHYSRVLMAAGLGQLVDLVIHEIGAPLGRIIRELSFVRRTLLKAEIEGETTSKINESLESIDGWLEQISNLRARLDPKTAGKRGRATSFDASEEILGNLNLYENLMGKQKIKVQFKRPNDPLIVHMPRSVLGQVIANLIDNSVYWLTKHHGEGNGGQIDISLKLTKSGFTVTFCDDGPGIPDQDHERIFEQYFTTKPNGMGLGLYIGRQVIEPHGKLIHRENCRLKGACFEAVFDNKIGL